jgi:hypothetical protein
MDFMSFHELLSAACELACSGSCHRTVDMPGMARKVFQERNLVFYFDTTYHNLTRTYVNYARHALRSLPHIYANW